MMLHLNPLAFLPFGILLGTAFAGAAISTFAARVKQHSLQLPPKRPSAEILRFPQRFQTALNSKIS